MQAKTGRHFTALLLAMLAYQVAAQAAAQATAQAQAPAQLQAQAQPGTPVDVLRSPATATTPAPVSDRHALGPAADAGTLERARGGSDAPHTTYNDTRLNGVVSGNSALQVVTGNNVIQSGSFADAAGLPIVIQNSGANVLIQNATIINLKFN